MDRCAPCSGQAACEMMSKERRIVPQAESTPGFSLDLSGIRAITFDVGGTLIEPWPSVGHIYAEVAAAHGWNGISPRILNRNFVAAWAALKDFRHTRRQWAALVDSTFCGLIETPPSKTFFPALYDRFGSHESWRIFDDVKPTLEDLKSKGLKLGVISNWDTRLRPLLRQLKLDACFDVIIVSCDLDSPKPSPEMFFETARRFGLPPRDILHVGDNFNMDVRGARGTGYNAVLLKRGKAPARRGAIRSLLELAQAR
jgi:putative hydrolase of the HAD superfamily